MENDLKYVFEKMSDGNYEVRLCEAFVCYSDDTNEEKIDEVLDELGFPSREFFVKNYYETWD